VNNIARVVDNLEPRWMVQRQEWETTKSLWDDEVRKRFEERYFVPFEKEVVKLFATMHRLEETFAHARKYVH
jgi:hypothetical protein